MSLVKNIFLKKEQFVLDIPSIELLDQGITLIKGPSGSGKSLFINTLIGFEKSEKNMEWFLGGKNLALLPIAERRLGVVFQTLDLFPHLTVQDNILFHAQARGLSKDFYIKKLEHLLDIAKLRPQFNQKTNTLSGGEKQRVAILRALIGQPQILILDEPFSSLDEENKKNLRDFLVQIVSDEKTPCILVSHDSSDEVIATKIIRINNGKILNT